MPQDLTAKFIVHYIYKRTIIIVLFRLFGIREKRTKIFLIAVIFQRFPIRVNSSSISSISLISKSERKNLHNRFSIEDP
jgi:hypothetical protein